MSTAVTLMTTNERELNSELYEALVKGNHDKVISLCQQIPKGPLHKVTIHDDTVLHMAAHSKADELVRELLNLLPETQSSNQELMCQNDSGNTILHEAATSNRVIAAAMELMQRVPALLITLNNRKETPLFRAARYGKKRMFALLDAEVRRIVQREADFRSFHVRDDIKRDDKTTILHVAILSENFDLALRIAEKYSYLTPELDGDGMTPLQILSCNPSAFKSGGTLNCLERLIYPRISVGATATLKGVRHKLRWLYYIVKKKQRYESALQLAKFLIARDTTWEATGSATSKSKPKTHRYGKSITATKSKKDGKGRDIPETPLFLATKSGCMEIVEEILEKYPMALEHIDDEGRNILHVAVKYRKLEVFDTVEKMEIPLRRLRQKTNNNGNSILHMVGKKKMEQGHEDMRSPALILQEDLLLFERVKNMSATHITKHFNSNGKTAEKLLTENNAEIHLEAIEWMKRTAENCSIIAVLISTVAFAAIYTVPGGPNDNGYPILGNHPFFFIFVMTDVLSLGFALTSVIIFLSVLTSPFRLRDFKQSLPQKLMFGVTLLILSVLTMMLAFAATVILLIHNKERWTKIALYSVAFFPVTIFSISCIPLYVSIVKTFQLG